MPNERLRLAVFLSGRSFIEIGRSCGLTRNQISDISRGVRAPRPDEARALARELMKPVEDLFPVKKKAA
jgi:transcriptional regulator with XRE-family HTH domain